MCGIVGLVHPKSEDLELSKASYEVYRALLTLQHRGQDAAGILSYDDESKRFKGEKDLGLVSQVFDLEKLEKLKGSMAIGHTRYATVGTDGKGDLQPIVTGYPFGVGMVHNGNLVNYHQLALELAEKYNIAQLTNNDVEVLLNLWCHGIQEQFPFEKEIEFSHIKTSAMNILDNAIGAYAIAGLLSGVGLFGLRDPKGIRPLILGQKVWDVEKNLVSYCLVSETNALNFLGFDYVRDIAPGEVIFIREDGKIFSEVLMKPEKPAPCMFEWVYFSAAESSFEGKSIYGVRLNLGRVLGKRARKLIENNVIHPDIVCPVPDTSRTSAIALSESLGLPYREGLIKNRYTQRSFILNTQDKREKAVELKLSPVRSEIEGKNILLVDDSIVRGTTSKKIIQLLKRYGAKEITLAITCPPLRHGCFYGIDFPKESELIANDKTPEEIAEYIGANRVIFLDEADLQDAIGRTELCMACVNKKYPTSIEASEEFARLRELNKEGAV
ncbi:MAG: amidophosphoribosyltransferase [Bacteriovoracaceae bacterium]|jgi:amidophosphoribosyltransferase